MTYLSPFCMLGKHGVCLHRYGHNVCECDCHGTPVAVAAEADAASDQLTYSQRAVQPPPPAPRRFWIEQVSAGAGGEYDAADVPRAFAELFNQMVADGTFVEIRVEEQPF